MGIGDEFKNKAEELKGRAKEALGDATDDQQLEAEGKLDQASARVKQGIDDLKDKAAEVFNDVTDKFSKKDDA